MLWSEYLLDNEEGKDDKDGLLKYKDKGGLLEDYALELEELEVKPTNAKKAKKVSQQRQLWERCLGLIAQHCRCWETQGICRGYGEEEKLSEGEEEGRKLNSRDEWHAT
jgi:hypothetical protein